MKAKASRGQQGPTNRQCERARASRFRYGAEIAKLEQELDKATTASERAALETKISHAKWKLLASVANLRRARKALGRQWRSTETVERNVRTVVSTIVRTISSARAPRPVSRVRRITRATPLASSSKGSDPEPPGALRLALLLSAWVVLYSVEVTLIVWMVATS